MVLPFFRLPRESLVSIVFGEWMSARLSSLVDNQGDGNCRSYTASELYGTTHSAIHNASNGVTVISNQEEYR